jgi:hypothetical protein
MFDYQRVPPFFLVESPFYMYLESWSCTRETAEKSGLSLEDFREEVRNAKVLQLHQGCHQLVHH